MFALETLSYLSTDVTQFIEITDDFKEIAENSGVTNGLVAVISAHTTTGIVVNEGLPCVETDIADTLDRLVPLDEPYAHAHFLPSYGATGNNSCGHIKGTLTGNHCLFPMQDGKVECGKAQSVYLTDFDGPQRRRVYVVVMGE